MTPGKLYSAAISIALASGLIAAATMGSTTRARAAERTEAIESRRHFDASDVERFKVYDEDPEHPWNRVYRLFFIREAAGEGALYGADELDPLLWKKSDYFLKGEGFDRAIKVLDDFLNYSPKEGSISNVKRALMQRDLWAVFDWLAANGGDHPDEALSLKLRLTQAINDLALAREDIEKLPDNYTATWESIVSRVSRGTFDTADPNEVDLPYDLLDANGDWIALWNPYAEANVTPINAAHVSGRSQFWSLMLLPEGRAETLDYLNRLKNPWNIESRADLKKAPRLRPRLPQFPRDTQVALIRQMVLIDNAGNLVPSPIIEAVQLRRFLTDPADREAPADGNGDNPRSTFIEYRMSHQELAMSTGPGLVRVPDGDIEYAIFETHANDPFSTGEVGTPYAITPESIYGRCTFCHSGRGILSIQSRGAYIPSRPKYPRVKADDISFDPVRRTSYQKETQYDWGMLKGMIEGRRTKAT